MKKTLIVLISLSLSVVSVFATDVAIAPMLLVDRVNDKKDTSVFIHGDLFDELGKFDTGSILVFSKIHNAKINPPQSVKDATAVAYNEKVEYLLYGFVTKDEYAIQATVNLFDANTGSNITAFYGSDSVDHYDRLIRDMANKILVYFDESLHLVALQESMPEQQSRLSVPVSIGYWTPTSSDWARFIIGTAAINSGLTFIPNDCLFIKNGNVYYASASLDVSYRYGIVNPDIQKGSLHSMGFALPFLMHRAFNDKQEIFGGLGPMYSLEILKNQEKYADAASHIYNDFGMLIVIGYQYNLDNGLHLLFDSRFDIRFYSETMISWSPRIGIEYTFMKEKVPEKWTRELKRD